MPDTSSGDRGPDRLPPVDGELRDAVLAQREVEQRRPVASREEFIEAEKRVVAALAAAGPGTEPEDRERRNLQIIEAINTWLLEPELGAGALLDPVHVRSLALNIDIALDGVRLDEEEGRQGER